MSDKITFEKGFIAILLLLAVGVLCWLFSDFLAALFFSVLICTVTYNHYHWLKTKNLSSSLAALIVTFVVSVLFILPLTYIILVIGIESSQLIQKLHFDQKTLLLLLEQIIRSVLSSISLTTMQMTVFWMK